MKFDVLFDSLTDSGPHNGVKNESGGFHRHSCDHGSSFAANSEDQLHSRRILRKYIIDSIRIHEPVDHTIDIPATLDFSNDAGLLRIMRISTGPAVQRTKFSSPIS